MQQLRAAGPGGVPIGRLRELVLSGRPPWAEGEQAMFLYVQGLLADMLHAGMVRMLGATGPAAEERWALDTEWFAGGVPGTNSPPPPPRQDQAGGGDSDGGGLREVLGHSLLFSLPADEFEAAIGRSLGGA